MTIEEYFKSADPQSVLFLGRVKNFTIDEIKLFLKQYNLSYTDELNNDVSIVIESSMQTPIEEDIAYEAYKQKFPMFKLEQFEELYSKKISPNSLLMSVKLSNDQQRIIRLLKNESFENSLYLKLFKMYDWGGEGVYDNDENRDVTITFVKRFYQKDRFMDPSIVYSPVTLSTIIIETSDRELLDAVLSMPNYEMNQSKKDIKKPKNIRELVSSNPNITQDIYKKLLNFQDLDIDYFLAANPSINFDFAKKLLERSSVETKVMLAHNKMIDDKIFKELLESEDEVVRYLLVFQTIDKNRLNLINEKNLDKELFSFIGENQNIETILDELLTRDDPSILCKLAANPLLNTDQLEALYNKYEFVYPLSSNPNLSKVLIKKFYKLKDFEIDKYLAANPSTPKEILEKYFQRDDFEINLALASNESLDLYYLQQLQLDTRLMNTLSNNKTFTDNILNNLGI